MTVRAGLCLLLGAICNVSVAWGFAVWEPQGSTGIVDVTGHVREIFGRRGFELPISGDYYGAKGSDIGLTFTSTIVESDPAQILILTEAGWPLRSLAGVFHLVSGAAQTETTSFHCAIELSPQIRARSPYAPQVAFVLPLEPIWPGFAINTILFAAAFWLLLVIPRIVRRRLRTIRRRCPACAYPIGTSTLCSECGAPVTPRRSLTEQ